MKFTNEKFKNYALNINPIDSSQVQSPSDAFFLLINGVNKQDLENLLTYILNYYLELTPNLDITIDDCYSITQNIHLNKSEKEVIYNLAIKAVQDGKSLSWISHCINAAQVCKTLAIRTNLDEQCAETLGLLHDYGRKYTHTFEHTIIGFEELTKLGWTNEAISCLTHSFLNGGRCSNNEPAEPGFYVDENGDPKWKKGTKKDDFSLFLESYTYSPYDYLVNIADLTATGSGIVPPHIRIADIATRRTIDPTNRAYFLCDLINTLIKLLNNCNSTNNFEYIKATPDKSLEEINDYFIKVSNEFYKVFFAPNKKDKTNKKVVK